MRKSTAPQSTPPAANSRPEFMNRIDKSVVFKTLRSEHLEQILEIELGMVQQRVLDWPPAATSLCSTARPR